VRFVKAAKELWEFAERLLAAGKPEYAAVAAFEAGVAVMIFQREAYRGSAPSRDVPQANRTKPEKTRSRFTRQQRLEIGHRVDEAIRAYMDGIRPLEERDARGRAYLKIGEALKKEHNLSKRVSKVDLRRYLRLWREESRPVGANQVGPG
jgi:hypothetical protein